MGISIENLSFHYTGTPVLDQVNLEVKDGDYAILTGENGSGKSTFLKLLLGELKAQEGSIKVNGRYLRNIRKGRSGICSAKQYQQEPEFSGYCGGDYDDGNLFLIMEGAFSGEKGDPPAESCSCGNGDGRILEKADR